MVWGLVMFACDTPSGQDETTPEVSCDASIDERESPDLAFSVYLGAVALQAGEVDGVDVEGWTWAKTGLLVLGSEAVEISVAEDLVGRATIEWGDVEATTRLRVPACGTDSWLVYPGGYHVEEPMCVRVDVRVGNEVDVHSVGVGAACE